LDILTYENENLKEKNKIYNQLSSVYKVPSFTSKTVQSSSYDQFPTKIKKENLALSTTLEVYSRDLNNLKAEVYNF
jgi:hypothetical protein